MAITMITGGARSGKSSFAEKLAQKLGSEVLYIATAIPYDVEMQERIKHHRAQRPAHWRTVEAYQKLEQVIRTADESVILLDCLTVMVTNLLFAAGINEAEPDPREVAVAEKWVEEELAGLVKASTEQQNRELIIVTNELGMGLVPAYPLGRIFRDLAGRANQRAAAVSDRVYLMISGIPVLIKGGESQ